MNSGELIKALMDNEKPFGLLSEEMRDKAREIGKVEFEYYQYSSGGWKRFDVKTPAPGFVGDTTYRLRPDYQEEQQVEKYDIYCGSHGKLWFNHGLAGAKTIANVMEYCNFVGFLYEGGKVCCDARQYKCKDTGAMRSSIYISDIDNYEVLTPTHVFFRKAK